MDGCSADTLTISATKFALPAITYDIRAPTSTFSWTDSDASSDNGFTNCGGLTWAITLTDGSSPIDSSIFTEGDYTAATKTIDIFTADISKAATYNIRVTVSYTDHPGVTQSRDFEIVL